MGQSLVRKRFLVCLCTTEPMSTGPCWPPEPGDQGVFPAWQPQTWGHQTCAEAPSGRYWPPEAQQRECAAMEPAALRPWRAFPQAPELCVRLGACASGWLTLSDKGTKLLHRNTGRSALGCLCAGHWGRDPCEHCFSICIALRGWQTLALLVFKDACFGDLSLRRRS